MPPPFRQLCQAKKETALQDGMSEADEAMIKDLKDERVPVCLYWTVENVVRWMEQLGFPQYRSCFEVNQVDGRRLIHITMSTLPQMGIQDYQHMKVIVGSVQQLLAGVKEPPCQRSISLPPREPLALYLEQKSRTGMALDALTYSRFLEDTAGAMWQPPTLANAAFVLEPADRIHVLAIHASRQK